MSDGAGDSPALARDVLVVEDDREINELVGAYARSHFEKAFATVLASPDARSASERALAAAVRLPVTSAG